LASKAGAYRMPMRVVSTEKKRSRKSARLEHDIMTILGIGTRGENPDDSREQKREKGMSVTCLRFLNGQCTISRCSRK
jgi:hypothetical protein